MVTTKAVIETGGKQYLVKVGDNIDVELLKTEKNKVSFIPLLILQNDKVLIGKPELSESRVEAKIIETIKEDKVLSIRFKAKKRVKKIKGHRQNKSKIQITNIK